MLAYLLCKTSTVVDQKQINARLVGQRSRPSLELSHAVGLDDPLRPTIGKLLLSCPSDNFDLLRITYTYDVGVPIRFFLGQSVIETNFNIVLYNLLLLFPQITLGTV